MTSVDLRTVWFNAVADPSDFLKLTLMSSLDVTSTKAGEVRPSAGGRRRSITQLGDDQSFSLSLTAIERSDIKWLEDHRGVELWIRDDRKRRRAGIFYEVPVSEHQYDERGDVSLSVTAVTQEIARRAG